MSQKSITGLMPLSTGGINEFTTIKVNEIQGNRYSNNQIDFYEKDTEYKSTRGTNFIINGGNTNSNSSFVIKNNTTEVLDIDTTSLDLKVGEFRNGGTALKDLSEILTNKSIDCNNNTLTNVPTSALSGVVLTTTDQNIQGVKTFSDNIVGNLTGNAATATTSSSCTGNSLTSNTLFTTRTIGGKDFNGSQNVVLSSTDLQNTSDIVLKDEIQTLTNKSIDSGQLTGTINNSRLSLSSSDLTNTSNIALLDATQTITSRKNFTGNGIIAAGGNNPLTMPGLINCNGKVYIGGADDKGITLTRSDLYDRYDGNPNGLTKREWNINTGSTNFLSFKFLQQTGGGAETETTALKLTTTTMETGTILCNGIQQPNAGGLEIKGTSFINIDVDYNDNNNTRLNIKYAGFLLADFFRNHNDLNVPTSNTIMEKSLFSAKGYLRARSIIQNDDGYISLGLMTSVGVNTGSTGAGELRLNRWDSSNGQSGDDDLRFHSIKVNCSTTPSQNVMEYYLHTGSTNTSQIKVMTLRGDNKVQVEGDLIVNGSISNTSGTFISSSGNNSYTGVNTYNANVTFNASSCLISGGMRMNDTGISYPTEQSRENAESNTFHALMFLSNKYRMNMNGLNTKAISSNIVSDVRLKSNIRDADDKDGTELINQLEVKRFDLGYTEFSKNLDIHITPMDNQIGFIAQDLEPLCPEAVEDEGKIKSIDLSYIVPYLVKNLQQNNKIIKDLNERLVKSEKEIDDLQETILGLMNT